MAISYNWFSKIMGYILFRGCSYLVNATRILDDPRIRRRRLLPVRPGRLPGAAPLPPQGRQSWHGRNVGEKLEKSWLKSVENLDSIENFGGF